MRFLDLHAIFMASPSPKLFAKKISSWYTDHERELPWRATNDPYKIWLSEIILQQTRVAQGLPYYRDFARKYPTVQDLAAASEREVLKTWEGLGYYSRARNLHACAKKVVKDFNGVFPDDYNDLLSLPGVGEYTAAAISSIAFGRSHAVVDGNVYRVLSRVFGLEDDISSGTGKKAFAALAAKLLDHEQPGIYNQALMEFGALQCVPKSPNCTSCVLQRNCHAYQHKLQDVLPVKKRKVKVKRLFLTYLIFKEGSRLAMRKRGNDGIWRGLYDFYSIETSRYVKPDKLMKEDKALRDFEVVSISDSVVHVLTHQKITARFVVLKGPAKGRLKTLFQEEGLRFLSPGAVAARPKPVLISRFLTDSAILD